jgi:hypothetical protein
MVHVPLGCVVCAACGFGEQRVEFPKEENPLSYDAKVCCCQECSVVGTRFLGGTGHRWCGLLTPASMPHTIGLSRYYHSSTAASLQYAALTVTPATHCLI